MKITSCDVVVTCIRVLCGLSAMFWPSGFGNTPTIICAWPGDGRECRYGFLRGCRVYVPCLKIVPALLSATGCTGALRVEKPAKTRASPHGMPYDYPRVLRIFARTGQLIARELHETGAQGNEYETWMSLARFGRMM